MKKSFFKLFSFIAVSTIVFTACGQSAAPTEEAETVSTPEITVTSEPETTVTEDIAITTFNSSEITDEEISVTTAVEETKFLTSTTEQTSPEKPYLVFQEGDDTIEYALVTDDDNADYIECWRYDNSDEYSSCTYRREYKDDVETVEDWYDGEYKGYVKWYLSDYSYSYDNEIQIWYDNSDKFQSKTTGPNLGHRYYSVDEESGNISLQTYDEINYEYGDATPVSDTEKEELLREAEEHLRIINEYCLTEEELTSKYQVVASKYDEYVDIYKLINQ